MDQDCWPVLRSLLGDTDVREGLEHVFGAVRRRGTATDVHPLRQISVLAEVSDLRP